MAFSPEWRGSTPHPAAQNPSFQLFPAFSPYKYLLWEVLQGSLSLPLLRLCIRVQSLRGFKHLSFCDLSQIQKIGFSLIT